MANQNLPPKPPDKADTDGSSPGVGSGNNQGGAPPPPPWVKQRTSQPTSTQLPSAGSPGQSSQPPVPPVVSPSTSPGQLPPVQGSAKPPQAVPSTSAPANPPVPPPGPTSPNLPKVPGALGTSTPDLSKPPPVPPPKPDSTGVKVKPESGGDSGAGPPASPPPPTFSTSSVAAAAKGKGGDLIKKLLPILGLVAVVGLLIFVIFKVVLPLFQGKSKESAGSAQQPARTQAELTYWGLWEPTAVVDQVITDYQQSHPGVKITYVQQSPKDYRERLQSALAAGSGPDIFRFHNTWVPMLKTELDNVPKGAINLDEYFPVVAQDLKVGTETVGIPLMFDSLALYYNPRLFNEAGKTVPTTWEEVRETAIDMTVSNSQGKIQTAGVALGTTNNVDHYSDILGLMLLQNGANPAKPTGQLAEDALRFYSLFSETDRVWDQTLPASTYAFATEKVAMILAPSWRAFQIKEINPDLQFRTAPAPQLPGAEVAWATYWVEGVSRRSKNTQAAWEFLKYLSSDEVLTKLYASQANTRMFGELYPKKSLAATIESDPVAGAFVKQGEIAESWYLCSRTFDNGINDRIIKYYEDSINAVLGGTPPKEALVPVASGVSRVLSQYGVGASSQ